MGRRYITRTRSIASDPTTSAYLHAHVTDENSVILPTLMWLSDLIGAGNRPSRSYLAAHGKRVGARDWGYPLTEGTSARLAFRIRSVGMGWGKELDG